MVHAVFARLCTFAGLTALPLRTTSQIPNSIVFTRLQSTSAGGTRSAPRIVSLGLTAAAFAGGWYTGGVAADLYGGKDKPVASTAAGPPTTDPSSGYPFTPLTPPTAARVTDLLNQNIWSVPVTSLDAGGVTRYDGSQLASNGACEDSFTHCQFPSPLQAGKKWMAWGVFDGHLGAQTAEALSRHLIPYVHHFLKKATSAEVLDDAVVHRAIKHAFMELDDVFIGHAQEIVDSDHSWAEKVLRLTPGTNGSCALLSMYDPTERKLHVACTGDSRAVLGRQIQTPEGKGKWETVPLSIDQGGSNEAEAERVRALHPGEPDVVKDGRVLGLATARTFGDGHWKWPAELQSFMRSRFISDTMRRVDPETTYKTPPYITAEPEVTTTVLQPGQPAFMIIASDGLWDHMSSEQAVELVGRWVDWRAKGKPAPPPVDDGFPKQFDYTPYYSTGWKVAEDAMTVQDENAAVHLTRNALGGARHDVISGLLSFKPPYSRYARDDITVQVVFFNWKE
ncbi:PP2C-like protein [Diplogelasinospora grovesii]|uniref:PP2C-like protein n=1 Tax=Diplogelasinospora grovesii TaxID=303347 RepID=A0AAN6N2U5_9PEZI|nr:PP2C-like protein [Diplogelasinospora grovesii]